MIKISTKNLVIISCDLEMLDLLLENKSWFQKKYLISVPKSWPVSPEALPVFREMIFFDNTIVGWLNYLVIHKQDKVLIGDCGFLGKPNNSKAVEIGYSIIPEYRGNGYAKEMVETLIKQAFTSKKVKRIIARTLVENIPSNKILKKNCFKIIQDNIETNEGFKRLWELRKEIYFL